MLKRTDTLTENFLVRLIAYGPLFFIPFVTFMISYIVITSNEKKFIHTVEDIEKSYLASKRNHVVSNVDIGVKLIEYKRSTTESLLKEKVKNRVDTAYSVAKNLYEANKGKLPQEKIQKIIIDSLRPLIWNNGESFIFILNFDGIFFLAPEYLRHLEGKSIIDFQDTTKRYVIKEEINVVKTQGSGYLWDTFTRPNYNHNTQYKQLAYVKKFDDYNWYLGSAEYLDTTIKEMEQSAIHLLEHGFLNNSDYYFAIDTDGNLILNGQDANVKKGNILEYEDVDGKKFIKELIKSANTQEPYFVSYKWKNPKTNKIETKYSYMKGVANSNWILGSGFYMDELIEQIALEKESLRKKYEKDYDKIIVTASIIVLLSLVVSFIVSQLLKKTFARYASNIEAKKNELIELNKSLEIQVQERTEELHHAYKDMKKIATTDTLTNIYNRYFFNDAFKNEFFRAERYNSGFSLCMFDIDYFKNINDNFGHDVGDSILQELTNVVKISLREGDIFARIGGEEFMIILPNTSLSSATEIAQRVRESVEDHLFSSATHVTISLGVTSYKHDDDQESLLKRVDNALYSAKKSGRNSVVAES